MDVPHVELPDLAGRGRLRGLSRPGRRSAGRLLRGQERRRGDGAAVHGQDAQDDPLLREKTGQPYPYAKYAQVCVPEFGGGMENISATTMTDARPARRDRRPRGRRRRPGRPRAGPPVVRRPARPARTGRTSGSTRASPRTSTRSSPSTTAARTRSGSRWKRTCRSYLGSDRQLPPADRRDAIRIVRWRCSTA